jgi:hypothetical protein
MKSKIINLFRSKLILTLFFLCIASLIISLAFIQYDLGPHGGTVKNAGVYNIELKNSYPVFYVFLLDRNHMPIKNYGITCDAKFIYQDTTSYNKALMPYSDDGFYSEYTSSGFNFCKINFNIRGRIVSAIFENDISIVKKK